MRMSHLVCLALSAAFMWGTACAGTIRSKEAFFEESTTTEPLMSEHVKEPVVSREPLREPVLPRDTGTTEIPSVYEPVLPDELPVETLLDAGSGLQDAGTEWMPERGKEPSFEPDTTPTPETIPEPAPRRPVLVGVGNFGARWVTNDGTKWTKIGGNGSGNPHTPDLLRAVAFGDGVFVAVGGHKNQGIMRSVDGGKTWKDVGQSTGGWLGGVTFSQGVWLACSGSGTQIHRSVDKGLTWKPVDMKKSTKLTPRPAGGMRGMASGGGKIVAHGDNGSVLLSVDGGATWTNQSPAKITHSFGQAATIAGHWFLAGFSIINGKSVAGCMTTTNFQNWKACPFTFVQGNNLVVTNGKLYLFTGKAYQVTSNGTTWSKGTTVVNPAYKAGAEWWGFRWNGVHVGTQLDKMNPVNTLRPAVRGWALGWTR